MSMGKLCLLRKCGVVVEQKRVQKRNKKEKRKEERGQKKDADYVAVSNFKKQYNYAFMTKDEKQAIVL